MWDLLSVAHPTDFYAYAKIISIKDEYSEGLIRNRYTFKHEMLDNRNARASICMEIREWLYKKL